MKKTFNNFVVAKCENGWTVEENWETPSKTNGYGDSHSKTYVCATFVEVTETMEKITKTWKLN